MDYSFKRQIICCKCGQKAKESYNQLWLEDSHTGNFYCEPCMDKIFFSQLRRESSQTVH